MTDTAVLGAISALNKKIDALGGSKEYTLPVTYTTIDRSEGSVTQSYVPFNGAYKNAASVRIGDDIYYFGGDDGTSVTNTCFKYDTTTNTVTQIANYPTVAGISYAGAVALSNGKIAVVGGQTSATLGGGVATAAYAYDPATDTWESHTSLASGLAPAGLYSYGNKVFVVTSKSGASSPYYIWYRDFSTTSSSWTSLTTATTAASYSTSARIGNIVYIFGGNSAITWSMDISAATPSLTSLTSSGVVWANAKTAVVGTNIYLLQSDTAPTGNYMYDTVANTWTSKTAIPYSSTGGDIVATNGTTKIWIFGRGSGTSYEFDVAGNSWTAKDTAQAGIRPYATPHSIDSDFILPTTTGSFIRFATSSGSWTTQFITPFFLDGASVVVGTNVYYFGGYNSATNSHSNQTLVYDTLTKQWSQKANMPRTRRGAQAVHISGKIYVIAGYNGSNLSFTDIYDIASNSWTTGANTPVAFGQSHNAGVADNGKIYVTYTTTNMYEYDPVGNTWATKLANTFSRTGSTLRSIVRGSSVYVFSNAANYEIYDTTSNTWSQVIGQGTNYGKLLLYNGSILMINDTTDSIVVLNESTNNWDFITRAEYSTNGLSTHSGASVIVGTKVLFVGPSGIRSMATYDLEDNWWNSSAMQANATRRTGGTAVYNGNLYIAGGANTSADTGALNDVIRYDPATNYWYGVATFTTARSNPGVAVWNGKLYVFGGTSSAGAGVTNVDEVDLGTGVVTAKTAMSANASNCKAVTVGDYIYVTRENTLWRYTPSNDSWYQISNIGNFYNGGNLVTDNKYVYLVGGYSSEAQRLYRFNPADFSFLTLQPLPRVRQYGHSTIANRKIYVSGVTAGYDVYDIVTGTWSYIGNSPIYLRNYGSMENIDGKIIVAQGTTPSSTTLLPGYGIETFVLPFDEVDALGITEAGVYYSLTPGTVLENRTSGRSGDSVAVGVGDDIYPVSVDVDNSTLAEVRLLRQ